MKKKLGVTGIVFIILAAVFSSTCWSMDFINMSNEELFELRGAIQNAPEPDKTAYQFEWEKRVATMTAEEKKQYTEPSKDDQAKDGELEPPRTPAKGYEKQGVQGQVIFGGFPQKSGSGR